jgi:NAD(P)-dependent dehydrogenase (short-subunit alcohol dehydrogenase family)
MRSMGMLDGKRALVTGGSSGIGAEIVRRFVSEGATVVFTGRDQARCQAVANEAGAGHVLADAGSDADTDRAVASAVQTLGGLDVLVNNAGTGVAGSLIETPAAEFGRILDVNVVGYLRYARAALPHLERSGAGSIVPISSDAGVIGEDDIGAYSVSKAAVVMLAKMLAVDCGPRGVRSNVICPGDIEPGMRDLRQRGEPDEAVDTTAWPLPPVGRIGRAGDVAAGAVFLASDQSAFCSGTVLLVDGGMRAGMRRGGRPTR